AVKGLMGGVGRGRGEGVAEQIEAQCVGGAIQVVEVGAIPGRRDRTRAVGEVARRTEISVAQIIRKVVLGTIEVCERRSIPSGEDVAKAVHEAARPQRSVTVV